MPRYRRPIRRRTPSLRLIAVQIVVLTVALIALLSFKDVIGDGTTAFVESLSAEDVQVNAPEEAPRPDRGEAAASQPDAVEGDAGEGDAEAAPAEGEAD